MSAVAVPHTADVIGDTGTIAVCVRAKVGSCIGALIAVEAAVFGPNYALGMFFVGSGFSVRPTSEADTIGDASR